MVRQRAWFGIFDFPRTKMPEKWLFLRAAAGTAFELLWAWLRKKWKNEWTDERGIIVLWWVCLKEFVNWNPLDFGRCLVFFRTCKNEEEDEEECVLWVKKRWKYAKYMLEVHRARMKCSQCSNHFKHSKSSIISHALPTYLPLSLPLLYLSICIPPLECAYYLALKSQNILSFRSHVDTL